MDTASITSPPDYRIPGRVAPHRQLLLTLGVGLLLGCITLYCWTNFSQRWAVYISIAFIAAGALPIMVRLARGIDRLLLLLFVFCIQLNLSFNVIYEDVRLPSGANGLAISLQLLLATMCVLVWSVKRYTGRTGPWTAHRTFVTACIIFLATSALSSITTTDHKVTMFGLFANLSLVVVALVAGHLFSTRKSVMALSNLLLVVLVTQSTIFLLQHATNKTFTMMGDVVTTNWGERVGGTMGIAPSSVATLFMVCLFFAEKRFFSRSQRPTLFSIVAFAMGILCLLLSLTRSTWIGFGIGSVYLLAGAFRRRMIRPSTVLVLGVCLMIAVVVAWRPVRDRLDANHHAAAEERWRLNYIGFEMIKAHPLLGIGLNMAYTSRRSYVPSFFTEDEWLYVPHNQYVIVAAETGLIGLAGFLAVLATALRAASRARRSRDPLVRETATALFVSICAMMWGMNLDFYAGNQSYVLLWFTLGAATGVWKIAEREEQTESSPALAS
jgi:hypothetical protein